MFITTKEDIKVLDRRGLLAFHENFYNSCRDLSGSEKMTVFKLFLGSVFEELGFITVGEGKWFKDQYLIAVSEEDMFYITISYEWEEKQRYGVSMQGIEILCLGGIIRVDAKGLREVYADVTLEILLDRVIKDIRNIWKKFVLGQELGEDEWYII